MKLILGERESCKLSLSLEKGFQYSSTIFEKDLIFL